MIVLDTSFLIDYFRNEHLSSLLPQGEKAAVTAISYYEIMAGIQRIKSPREEKFFRHFFSDVEILEFDVMAADIASGIGARMAKEGNRVNAFDILIAGIALANHAAVIITADTDFNEIAKYAGIEIRNYQR
ncbi:type II toxin-antitoxin system VapC family toxin [Methanoregula sp.]|uniref:type II toxin-antitoxin system VapC family toxin n=1 Tax=Methanoregula sp. TaxID=2052170 RepID=UPI00236C00BC|nr:type II toxin-antitoxin system VapC family toxin [Methanoregula sp.]MDD1687255.1 type II toxin-antitoxin system VapC family toxin [Methanoregula sp.]